MRIALGADHAGVALKHDITRLLTARGFACTDVGTMTADPVDYPVFAARVAEAVASGACDRGILICGTGIGMAIAANKVPGIRAAASYDETTARLCRAHNDANVLTLGARLTDAATAARLVDIFLETPFDAGRHARRVAMIAAMTCDAALT
ncbi:MAG TPA: ribose 5-phosphate isomerase B [Vicinamibacterales bacterium]|jgi:ribose 5-phosphate isomerase B|nr:ribose 5-phosphate isomerase B [Vicinamibacterales bacterium]